MKFTSEKRRIHHRDRERLSSLGYDMKEFRIVYINYHSDNSDRDWINDIMLMTPAEKKIFKKDNPNHSPKMINKGKLHSYKDCKELW